MNKREITIKTKEFGRKFTGHMRWHKGNLEQLWEITEVNERYNDGSYNHRYFTEKREWIIVPTE